LLEVGQGDISAGIQEVLHTIEALPADVLARLVDEARATDADQGDPDDAADQ
jgi:hypothetical protein